MNQAKLSPELWAKAVEKLDALNQDRGNESGYKVHHLVAYDGLWSCLCKLYSTNWPNQIHDTYPKAMAIIAQRSAHLHEFTHAKELYNVDLALRYLIATCDFWLALDGDEDDYKLINPALLAVYEAFGSSKKWQLSQMIATQTRKSRA